ncbi:MAG: HAD family hydrolase [Synergistes jonesii]|uniref:HAD family hydrolase n=1 Tax=Synergistes jonesii TaxID=2754 RepID=UPI002A759BDC|nr:HAD family hydrolase [Synergistes jonesii]MDY2985009.1 HAD family hydrolase [Synergistes jonesii]
MGKPTKAIVAIMYDFDKTLSTKDMQEYGFIPNLGLSAKEFWNESGTLAKQEQMDSILAYMRLMLKKASEKSLPVTRDKFVELGKDIEYYPGVEEWFERIDSYGKENGITIEHYVISSGLKEIIEGSSIKKHFKEIYACEFLYDENGVAVWPKLAVNYTNKTQFLFRINKGVLDVSEDEKLNEYVKEEERRIPFRNMIYIGDGLTDVPCMKLVKLNNGQSIAVFKKRKKYTAAKLMEENRVDFITEADYRKDGELDKIVRTIIEKMAVVEKLARLHDKHKKSIEKAVK